MAPWDEDSARRLAVLRKWLVVVESLGELSGAFRKAGADLEASLEDTFSTKAEVTLRARFSAVDAYLKWCSKLGRAPWPATEEQCYLYLTYLKKSQAAATKANRFLKALAFTAYTLEVDGVREVVRSTQIQGSAWRQFARKRETVGRAPFTVPQVKLLQAVVCGKGGDIDRLLAGLASLLTATRLRFVDAQRARREPALDVDKDGWGYVEVPLGDVKTNTFARPQDKNAANFG